MTLKQILTFDVGRVLHYDINRIPQDVGRALSLPLKAVCGSVIGAGILALASIASGWQPSDAVAFPVLVLCAVAVILPDLRASARRRSQRQSHPP